MMVTTSAAAITNGAVASYRAALHANPTAPEQRFYKACIVQTIY
jgi:hypothetical protein